MKCWKFALRSVIHSLNHSLVSAVTVETFLLVLLKMQNLIFCFYHHLCGLLLCPFSFKKNPKLKFRLSGDRCGHSLQQIMWSQRNPYIISHVEHIFFFSNSKQGYGDRYNSALDVCPKKVAKRRVCMHFGWRGSAISWRHLRYSCTDDITVPQYPPFLLIQFSTHIKVNNTYSNMGYVAFPLYCKSLQCYQTNWNPFPLRE